MTRAPASGNPPPGITPDDTDALPGFPRLAASAAGFHPWLLLAMLGEQQVAFASDCARAMLHGLETLGKVQEQVAQQTMLLHERAATASRQAPDLHSLAMLPWTLLLADVTAATRFWGAVGQEAVDQAASLQRRVSRYLADEQQVGVALLPQLTR